MKLNNPICITEQNWPEGTISKVSVFNWVYNHKDFIRESIESILIQKTTFPVEIIIHDDASNDGTKEIILEYQKIYPQLFNNILHKENQWSQGKSVMTPLFENPVGKYIALTHGDDYWTDPLKLQKQVDFLEENPEYVVSFHDYNQMNEKGKIIATTAFQFDFSLARDFTCQEMKEVKVYIPTLTMVFRNVINPNLKDFINNSHNGDIFIMSVLGNYGKAKFQREIQNGVYRIHLGGVYSNQSHIERLFKIQITINQLIKYYRYYNDIKTLESLRMTRFENARRAFYIISDLRDKNKILRASFNYLILNLRPLHFKEITNILKTFVSIKLKQN